MGISDRISDIRDIDREDVSDFVWKWRCKVFPRTEISADGKPLDLGSSIDGEKDDGDNKKSKGKKGTPGKNPEFGSEASVKTMFESRNSNPPSFEWVDYPPKQLSKSAARVQERVAIKVFKIKDREKPSMGGRFPLRFHNVEIQNPALVAALEPIVKKENLLLDVNEPAKFTYPFRPLWFCQDEITELYKNTDNAAPLKGYLQLLIRVMDEMFAEMRTKRRHTQASGLVDFRTAWTLFASGSTVYTYGTNAESICKVEDTKYEARKGCVYLDINAKILTFNGEEFVWEDITHGIPSFEGKMPIKQLDHYPLEFHAEKDDLMRRLISRGKKMLDLQGLQYSCYNGLAIHLGSECPERHNVEGRILVDVVGYNKFHLTKGKRENKTPETERNVASRRRHLRRIRQMQRHDDEDSEEEEKVVDQSGPGGRLNDEEQALNKEDMLSREEELGFMSGLVGGYALKNKLWMKFFIDDIEPMVWNDKAYEHLVYDEQQKDLVLSFVENHPLTNPRGSNVSSKASAPPVVDVIIGKGQGLIMLLSGPPGTGKTLTAEAVADRTHRPLFYLQAEDLGISAAALGTNVKRVFEMATEWDAVILLDEADVFLAERSPHDIHRNELVSIFLRELEYFRGIIFLTTNLFSTIDTAFRSRVSLHLLFQSLDKTARETVWRKFLQRLPARVEEVTDSEEKNAKPADKPLDEEDVKELALWQLNGREIKNAVKMVRNWCDHKDYVMTLERMESGIKATNPHTSKEGDVDRDLYE